MHRSNTSSTVDKRKAIDNERNKPSKRPKINGEAGSRKQFLNSLRAICDRWASHVHIEGSGGAIDGKELLRSFLRETLPPKGKKFPLQECDCRHKDGFLPSGKEMCRTSGTVDNGKGQAFVMSDFKQSLRQWLKSKQKNPTIVVTDVEDSDSDEEDEEPRSQPISISSYEANKYPSSPLKPGDATWKRKSTKQRLAVLFYLLSHSDNRDAFNSAYKKLCESDLYLVHLCGCGINTESLHGACVEGSHLKLASALLNREHVHYHFVLSQLSTKESYLATLCAIKGGADGNFDDVF